MSETKLSSRSSSATRSKKKKVNQIPFGIILLIALIALGFFLAGNKISLALMWFFGISAGFILQRSRFCFTASLRDPVLTGGTSLTKAVIIAVSIATVGFVAIQYSAVSAGNPVPGNISPVGVHTAVGAVVFGIGAVIAGGCASGTLMRVGEGFLMQMLALVFFVIGCLWGAKDFAWWSKNFMPKKGVFLPEIMGWIPALVLQFALLLGLYILADWYGDRKSKNN